VTAQQNIELPRVRQEVFGKARSRAGYICRMAETFKCPHCGALYEITHDKADPRDNHAADCQVCGKQMVSTNGSSIPCYELVKMPYGTNV
jgi:hypothetical protein